MLAIDFTGGGLPADQTANAYLFVGDHSSSNSEIYRLRVEDRLIQPSSHGEVKRERGTFERGESYFTSVDWVSTNRTDEDGNEDPDYDYRAWVDRLANPRWTSGSSVPSSRDFFVTDPGQMFQRRHFGSETDAASGKQAFIHFPAVDLDIDSDNSGLINGSLQEDIIENNQRDGMQISVFSSDIDNDGVADNYDFDGVAGVRFTPVNVSLSSNLGLLGGTTSLSFDFDDAGLETESNGLFRLWKKDASSNRTEADLIYSGSSVNTTELGLNPGGTATLYLEAVNPTRRTVNFDPIEVTASVNAGIWSGTLTDKVHARGAKVAIDVSVNGDSDLTDAVDGIDKFLPGYEGDTQVLNDINAQTVKLIITGLEEGSSVDLSLNDTTQLKGLTGNLGITEAFDFQFSNGNQQILDQQTDANGDLIVDLRVLDFGGSTIVKVSDANGVELASLAIPLDGDGDKLPDVFEDRFDTLDKTAEQSVDGIDDAQFDGDLLTQGGNDFAKRGRNVGDKLTAFDEYRGFILDDGHFRTSPEDKDVFVFDELGEITIPDGTANGTPLEDDRFDFFDDLGAVLHAFTTPNRFDPQNNKLNKNSEAETKADVIRLQKDNALPPGINGVTVGRSSSIAIDAHFREIDIISVGSVGDIPVVVYKPEDLQRFANNGRIRIGSNVYDYQRNFVQIKAGAAGDVILQEETENIGVNNLPDGSQTIILSRNTSEEYEFLHNERTGEVINLSFSLAGPNAHPPVGGDDTTVSTPIDAGDTEIVLSSNGFSSASVPAAGALLYVKIGDEYIGYDGVQNNPQANTVTLTGVLRGQLGTNPQAHAIGATASIPSQFTNVDRGALGTEVGDLQAGDKLTPVAFLANVKGIEPGQAAPPQGSAKFSVYSDAKSVLQATIAHELTHALTHLEPDVEHGIGQPREESIINSIMGPATTLGRYVGGELGQIDPLTRRPLGSKLFTNFSDATRELIDLLFEV